jgi:hypothetical protein
MPSTVNEPKDGSLLPKQPEAAGGKYRLWPTLAKRLKAKPTYPPEELFKMPSYKKDVILLNPYLYRGAIIESLNAAKDKINSLKNDLGHEIRQKRSDIYDALVNEAANRHISK